MSSGCRICSELADAYVTYSRKLEWTISRQRLEAMRHVFHAISAYEEEVQHLNQMRRDVLARMSEHEVEHRTGSE